MDNFLAAENLERINAFRERTGLSKRTYHSLGKKLLLLTPATTGPMPQEIIRGYLDQHLIAEQNGISNNCFDIARTALAAGCATGTMHSVSGSTQDFIGWANHCVNFDELPDETVLAIDLTASRNIDRGARNFDVLALRALDTDSLQLQIGELFGGEWQMDHT
ncbi:MAG TPA: hypothetical protein VFW77_00820 [Candidatus Saccharimonadales bacterium]|nr:hypothetical protein [Candidatus Saccharimonadales bacterium]